MTMHYPKIDPCPTCEVGVGEPCVHFGTKGNRVTAEVRDAPHRERMPEWWDTSWSEGYGAALRDLSGECPPCAACGQLAAPRSGAGERLIQAERRRQITDEGFTAEHDREHGGFALAQAAYCYQAYGLMPAGAFPDQWPWVRESWKPRDPISNLIRAGALYSAAADLGYPSAAEGARRCAALLDASIVRLTREYR